jgi:hypothetical protein
MQDLKALLSRYTNIGVSERYRKEVIQKVLQKTFGIVIHNSSITIKENRARVHLPAAARYTLHEQKKEILSEINAEMGPHSALIDIV